jgi:hemerythrin-like domain-containing protein
VVSPRFADLALIQINAILGPIRSSVSVGLAPLAKARADQIIEFAMNIRIGEAASPTFQQPLALMSDCHRRVERFLGLLLRVTAEAAGGPLNPLQREALETALRYFREAAPQHTADEEESLFPRLRGLDTSESREVLNKVEQLEMDHKAAAPAHHAVEIFGRLWLVQKRLEPDELVLLQSHLDVLHALYGRHIAVEDTEVFPLAARLLGDVDLAAIGREMAARRGQPFEPIGLANRSKYPQPLPHHAAA